MVVVVMAMVAMVVGNGDGHIMMAMAFMAHGVIGGQLVAPVPETTTPRPV